jgi:serine protease AprX
MARGVSGVPRPQVLSIPERLDANQDLTGRGVVMGFVDSGFYPHPDLMRPTKRIRVYADATRDIPIPEDFFAAHTSSWHGTMTACTAAGNGYVSGGRYRGLASEAEVVLIKCSEDRGRILGKQVAHAIRFPLRHPGLGIRVLNVSVGVPRHDGDKEDALAAVREVVAAGIAVFVAAGNRPGEAPEAPASAPEAIVVGGWNDKNTRASNDDAPWPSSYGNGKPDLLAPAIWLPAPMLPGTLVAREGIALFNLLSVLEESSAEYHFSAERSTATPAEREAVDSLMEAVARRVSQKKYISQDYQHVEGTSFASPIAASVAAQMLEVDPSLTPSLLREGLMTSARPIRGVPKEVQGGGVLRPRLAVKWVYDRMKKEPPRSLV